MLVTAISSLICLVFGVWIGKLLADHKWSSNALQPYHIEYDGLLYKVQCEQRMKGKGAEHEEVLPRTHEIPASASGRKEGTYEAQI